MSTTFPAPQSRTILGPLTTTFVPPASCTAAALIECVNCNTGWLAQACSPIPVGTTTVYGGQDDRGCWPARDSSYTTTTNINYNNALFGWGFYSPGLICPTGYATACSAVGGVSSNYQFQYSVLAGETAIGCCPSGYSCALEIGAHSAQTCLMKASSTSFVAATCSAANTVMRVLTVPEVITITTTRSSISSAKGTVVEIVSTFSSYSLYAPMIQINHQKSDITQTTGSSTTFTVSSSQTSSSTPASTSTSSPSNTPQSGLSSGVKAGIGIGVTLGFSLVLALIAFMLYRRRKGYARAKQNAPVDMGSDLGPPLPTELFDSVTSSSAMRELPGNSMITELSGAEKKSVEQHYNRAEMG